MVHVRAAQAPSAYQVAAAMSEAARFATDLSANDPALDHDSLLLALDSETPVMDVLRAVIRASIEAASFAEAIAARQNDLAERKNRYLKRKEGARQLAVRMMEALDMSSLSEPDFGVSLRPGNPEAKIADVALLPEAFVRVKRSADMALINAAIRQGQVPEGVEVLPPATVMTVRSK
jgi:Siphovirus Gp157